MKLRKLTTDCTIAFNKFHIYNSVISYIQLGTSYMCVQHIPRIEMHCFVSRIQMISNFVPVDAW